ncbi:hypothetical protein EV356DRAFT_571593 [Viridothelium virens]|uniref:Uncharacterized protein n=1 Tax=Viridothelium virens TaxID=1048519 RepID=A0A6A6GT61_VIRVR|nr:hypothetical protein EV356DRAFT_571593 [Viridothelium virens]
MDGEKLRRLGKNGQRPGSLQTRVALAWSSMVLATLEVILATLEVILLSPAPLTNVLEHIQRRLPTKLPGSSIICPSKEAVDRRVRKPEGGMESHETEQQGDGEPHSLDAPRKITDNLLNIGTQKSINAMQKKISSASNSSALLAIIYPH